MLKIKGKTDILHFIDHAKVGGPGKTILNSFKYIDHQKYNIHVASFISNKEDDTEFAHHIKSNNIPFLGLIDKRGINKEYIDLLSEYIKKEQIKILHTHGYKTNIIGLILKLKINNLIVVSTQHGWIKNSLIQRIVVKLDKFCTRFFDGIIAVSEPLYSSLPGRVKKQKSTIVIHNAIIPEDYQFTGKGSMIREKFHINSDTILIGIIGRLSIEKGCIEFLDVFNSLIQRTKNISLMYVGSGNLDSQLMQKAKNYNIENVVFFPGHQFPIQPYLEAIDILVSPSFTEGLSNVILEAMVNKIPVIATDVGGNSEIIENGHNGILVPSVQSNFMFENLNYLINDEIKRQLLACNGYKTIFDKFLFTDRMYKIEKFYEIILNKINYN